MIYVQFQCMGSFHLNYQSNEPCPTPSPPSLPLIKPLCGLSTLILKMFHLDFLYLNSTPLHKRKKENKKFLMLECGIVSSEISMHCALFASWLSSGQLLLNYVNKQTDWVTIDCFLNWSSIKLTKLFLQCWSGSLYSYRTLLRPISRQEFLSKQNVMYHSAVF